MDCAHKVALQDKDILEYGKVALQDKYIVEYGKVAWKDKDIFRGWENSTGEVKIFLQVWENPLRALCEAI